MLPLHRIVVVLLAMAAGSLTLSAQAAERSAPQKPVSPETAATAAAPPTPDGEVLTIFGRRRPGTYPRLGRINADSPTSCAFIGASPSRSIEGGGEGEETYDDYLHDTGSRQRDRYASLRQKAPFGSAKANKAEMMLRQPGLSRGSSACSDADVRFDAGRDAIASRDTLLRDAYQAFDAKDYSAALDLFRKSYIKMGYPDAALMIGKMHLIGLGTPQNTSEAVKWLTKVTEAPFNPRYGVQRFDEKDPDYMSTASDAAMRLGRIYMTGWGVPKDAAKSRKYHLMADKFGFIPGTYIVGRMFDSGYGGEKSVVKAAKYYLKAGEVGYAPAQYDLGLLLREGDEGVTAKPKEGAQWLLEAAKRGHRDALYEAGRMYDLGLIVAADPQKAIVYYKEAALKGNAQAQTALGTYFYTGKILPLDMVMARRWFFYAAEGGDPQAMLNLGVMFMNGEGGDKDQAMAFALFRLAERAGLGAGAEAAANLEVKLTADEKARAVAILNPPAA